MAEGGVGENNMSLGLRERGRGGNGAISRDERTESTPSKPLPNRSRAGTLDFPQ